MEKLYLFQQFANERSNYCANIRLSNLLVAYKRLFFVSATPAFPHVNKIQKPNSRDLSVKAGQAGLHFTQAHS